ncbi:hypothetical protein J5TS2_29430 [Brevibacillus halotolerans]|nr:hypothetical protein J5TS2_29430 [Brevibacillus halotolerans]
MVRDERMESRSRGTQEYYMYAASLDQSGNLVIVMCIKVLKAIKIILG